MGEVMKEGGAVREVEVLQEVEWEEREEREVEEGERMFSGKMERVARWLEEVEGEENKVETREETDEDDEVKAWPAALPSWLQAQLSSDD